MSKRSRQHSRTCDRHQVRVALIKAIPSNRCMETRKIDSRMKI